MPLRILMVSDSYPPLIGGATRDTQLLSKELVRRGYTVDVATVGQPGLPERDDDDGVHVHRIDGLSSHFSSDPYRRHHPPLPDPTTVLAFRRLIRQARPDLVHSYGWLTYSCAAALPRSGTPLLVSIRDYGNVCAIRTLMQQQSDGEHACSGPVVGKCLACAQHYYHSPFKTMASVGGVYGGAELLRRKVWGLHYCSSYVRDVTRRHLLSGHTFERPLLERVISSFRSDVADGEPDEKLLAHLPAEPFILFVGALRLVKGIEPLLAAYQRLSSPPPLVLLGQPTVDTPQRFPPGVIVVPGASHATVMATWERALFGVAPSILPEPFGNVVHEGMSKGKTMIGTAPSGMTDMIVDGATGLLTPRGDVVALTRAMQQLIDDAPLRERLGRAAQTRAALFTTDVVMPHFERLYHDLVAKDNVAIGLAQ